MQGVCFSIRKNLHVSEDRPLDCNIIYTGGGLCPRTPRPVSDDDTVDNFSCRQFGVFLIFRISKKLGKKRTLPGVRFSRQVKISKLYLYKLYYYKNLFFISQCFLPEIRQGF